MFKFIDSEQSNEGIGFNTCCPNLPKPILSKNLVYTFTL